MIAFKVLKPTVTGTTTYNEDTFGGSGGQPDWTGYILDATTATAITVNLPKANLCEGKTITFLTVNPSLRTITINAASGETIIYGGQSNAFIANSVNHGMVGFACNGTRWYTIASDNTILPGA